MVVEASTVAAEEAEGPAEGHTTSELKCGFECLLHLLPLAITRSPRDSPLKATEMAGVEAIEGVVDTKAEAEAMELMEPRVSQLSQWPTLNLLSRYCF